jgi:hypothetical protein
LHLDDVAVVGQPVDKAVVILASPNTLDHSAKVGLVVIITLNVFVELGQQVEQQRTPAWLNGGCQFIQHHQVHAPGSSQYAQPGPGPSPLKCIDQVDRQ